MAPKISHQRGNVPDCTACQDPAGLPARLTEDRARLDARAALVRDHRALGDEARERYRAAYGGTPEFYAAQTEMRREYGTANAIATGLMVERGHLDRVEAAHAHLVGAVLPADGRAEA